MGKYYLCRACGKIYDGDCLKYPFCPDKQCDCGDMELIELDELMVYPIQKLHELGYYTRFCCSGHWFNSSLATYIYFDDYYKPEGCPDKWYVDGDSIRYGRNYSYEEWNTFSPSERQKIIFKGMDSLYEWVDNLPYCEQE